MGNQFNNYSDEELVEQFRLHKSNEAFSVLYDRYATLVYGVSLKYLKDIDLAKDATMQIFEKLIHEIPRHDIQLFKAWLYRVAQNHCFMQLRSNNHLTKYVDVFPENSMEFIEETHHIEEKEQQLEKMEHALTFLNTEQKKCIELFYLEKKTYTEIMNSTGFSYLQVKSFIQNGKRNLKQKMIE